VSVANRVMIACPSAESHSLGAARANRLASAAGPKYFEALSYDQFSSALARCSASAASSRRCRQATRFRQCSGMPDKP
jgi:hypothetical protein